MPWGVDDVTVVASILYIQSIPGAYFECWLVRLKQFFRTSFIRTSVHGLHFFVCLFVHAKSGAQGSVVNQWPAARIHIITLLTLYGSISIDLVACWLSWFTVMCKCAGILDLLSQCSVHPVPHILHLSLHAPGFGSLCSASKRPKKHWIRHMILNIYQFIWQQFCLPLLFRAAWINGSAVLQWGLVTLLCCTSVSNFVYVHLKIKMWIT